MKKFEKLLRGARIVKKQDEKNIRGEHDSRFIHKKAWPTYTSDIRNYLHRFDAHMPDFTDKLQELIRTTHKEGRKAVAIDLFGEASGKSLGFDTTITLGLTKSEVPGDETMESIAGSVASAKTQEKYKEVLERVDGNVLFAFADPVGGFSFYEEDRYANKYMDRQLERLFDLTYEKLHPNGYMLIGIRNLNDDPSSSNRVRQRKFEKLLKKRRIAFSYAQGEEFILIQK